MTWKSLRTRLERLLQIDLTYLIRGGSWLALGQFVASASVFILAIAFANLIPKDVYGTYKYVQSVAGIFAIASMSGINTYIAQAVARGAEATFPSGMRARIRTGLLGGLGLIVVAGYYFFKDNALLGEAFLIAALAVPFMDSLGLYNVYLQSKKLFKESIIYFSIVQIASSACVLLAVLVTSNLFVLVIAYFIPPVLLRWYFHRHTLAKFKPNDVDDPQAIRYGAHLSIVNVLGTLATYIDSILLYHLLGPISVAIYSFAIAPVDQIRTLYSKNLPALALPKLAHRRMHEIDAHLVRRLILLALGGLAVALLYIAIAPFAFMLVFPKYLDAVTLSQVLALLLIILLPSTYIATVIQAKMHVMPRSWIYAAVVPDVTHIVVLLVFVPMYGVFGIMFAKTAEALVALVISFVQWRLLARREEGTIPA